MTTKERRVYLDSVETKKGDERHRTTEDGRGNLSTEGAGIYDPGTITIELQTSVRDPGEVTTKEVVEAVRRGLVENGGEGWTWERFRQTALHDAGFSACVKRLAREAREREEQEWREMLEREDGVVKYDSSPTPHEEGDANG